MEKNCNLWSNSVACLVKFANLEKKKLAITF